MGKSISVPRYEPARAYHAPKPAAFEFGVDTVTIGELMDTPATREIVFKNAPWAKMMVANEAFINYASIFTLPDIAAFLPPGFSDSIAKIDAALRLLPRSEWPADVR